MSQGECREAQRVSLHLVPLATEDKFAVTARNSVTVTDPDSTPPHSEAISRAVARHIRCSILLGLHEGASMAAGRGGARRRR